MMRRILFLVLLFSFYTLQEAQAEETDQFTLPPAELLDIGSIVSHQLCQVIETSIAQTNSEIQTLLQRSKHSRNAAVQLALRRKDAYLADLIYRKSGLGFPRWLHLEHLSQYPNSVLYKEVWPWKTIYWLVFSQTPMFLLGLAPTINMYGYHFGTDKLNHFFMQGYTYYKLHRHLIAQGKTAEQAQKIMVNYGQFLEQTYLGILINGIYSNADLAANYAGWKFYMNLGNSIKIGEQTLPPLLVLNGDKWELAKHINKSNLLKPYLSDNLNEALNPSRYLFMRSQIRKHIQKRCDDWTKQRGITRDMVQAKLKEISLWHGESYGHWLPAKQAVTLNTCFGGS